MTLIVFVILCLLATVSVGSLITSVVLIAQVLYRKVKAWRAFKR